MSVAGGDVTGMRLIVLRPFASIDVAAKVDTEGQFLFSLVARLYREDPPTRPCTPSSSAHTRTSCCCP